MQESDLIGICEDLHRQRALVMDGFGEMVRLIAMLRAYRDEFLTPLVSGKDIAGMAADRDIPTEASEAATQVSALTAAVNDAADFTEVEDLKTALDTFFAMAIFHPDTYTIRPEKALKGVDKVLGEFEAAKIRGRPNEGMLGS